MGSQRPAPPPLSLGGSAGEKRNNSFGSESSTGFRFSGDSARDRAAAASSRPTQSRKSSASSPTSNVYSHCGRHSNSWLFGDVSVTDLFRRKKE